MEYEDPGWRSKIFQNLYITCGLKILIIYRVSRAILYIDWISDIGFAVIDFLK